MKTLGERLKALRKYKNLTQTELAALIGSTKSTICSFENNQRVPSCAILIKVADVFNVSTDYLLGRQSNNVIDISGLTAEDLNLVESIVASLAEKTRNQIS